MTPPPPAPPVGKMQKPGDPFVPGIYPRSAHHGHGIPAPRTGPDAVYR